jgi:TATA-binding protein-associated factor Taf7
MHSFIQTIESVEQEVERLLEQDAAAAQVKYGPPLNNSSPISTSTPFQRFSRM